MFFVLLRFSVNKSQARQHMEAHNAWIRRGVEEGVFLVVGSLQPNQGGAIVAHGVSADELQHLVDQDPFVTADVVRAEILAISPSMADRRLAFVLDEA